jgi:hypothetical protein
MPFDMQAVSSANLAQVGFNAETNQIRVLFNSGATYEYDRCTQDEADEIIAAASPNDAFADILKGLKPYRRVTG